MTTTNARVIRSRLKSNIEAERLKHTKQPDIQYLLRKMQIGKIGWKLDFLAQWKKPPARLKDTELSIYEGVNLTLPHFSVIIAENQNWRFFGSN